MEYYYLFVLRLLHITCGSLWVGAAVYLSLFVLPAVHTLGNEGGKFMQQLAKTNRLPAVMNTLSTITVITGILLLYQLSDGFTLTWLSTAHGLTLLVGGLVALIAYISAFIFIVPTVAKINTIGKQIAQRQGPPTPEQQQEIGKLSKKIAIADSWIALLLVGSLILMSVVRYI